MVCVILHISFFFEFWNIFYPEYWFLWKPFSCEIQCLHGLKCFISWLVHELFEWLLLTNDLNFCHCINNESYSPLKLFFLGFLRNWKEEWEWVWMILLCECYCRMCFVLWCCWGLSVYKLASDSILGEGLQGWLISHTKPIVLKLKCYAVIITAYAIVLHCAQFTW